MVEDLYISGLYIEFRLNKLLSILSNLTFVQLYIKIGTFNFRDFGGKCPSGHLILEDLVEKNQKLLARDIVSKKKKEIEAGIDINMRVSQHKLIVLETVNIMKSFCH